MKAEKNNMPKEISELRRRAEEKKAQSPENIDALLPEEVKRILHELRVHQIELEMQNEELRTSHAELKTERARYLDLYDLAPVGYCTISEEGLILEANLTASVMLDLPRGALVTQNLGRFIFKEDQDIYYLHRNQLFKTKEPQSLDLRMLKKDGTVFWAHLVATVIQDDCGCPQSCHIILDDITKRNESVNALKEIEERFAQLAEQSRTTAWEVDPQGIYTYISEVSLTVLGYRPDELEGKMHFYDIHPESNREEFRKAVFAVFARKEKFLNLENPIQTKNGRQVWVLTNGFPILNADGTLRGYCGSDTDITERKRAEEEKTRLENQLHQSQKLESIGQLAGGIAHDFNNMLSVISGYSEIVLSKMNASDPNYSRVQEINKAGKRSADLTRQLLTFARKQTIAPKVLDLNVSVAGMLKMLQRLIGENIKLIWAPAANLWKVKMDPSQIDQILANLLVNTRDAISGIGKVIIEIGNAELDEAFCKGHLDFTPGKYVVLSVSDNGCGMSKETIDHIFEPFFTTKKVGEGTGLGLATVFGIVKQNDGFINVYSEPGKGTAFKIYLPRHESENVGQEDKHEKTKRITGIETVLLVEDETAMLQFVKSQLEDLGYTVLTTDRPIKAIKIAGEYKGDIHLLMTDVVMPEMSGRDLKEKINQIRSGIKCLFMSGYSKNIMSHNGGIDEGIHFLQKPFTIEALSVKVREALA